ncbi:MAG: DNA replication/repair protein RecF [Calditrichia bacterium]
MILETLNLTNFRNYKQAEVGFRAGTNVLFGKNGQGKTNILESIYYLALTKSFRTSSDPNLISNKEKYFRIQGDLKSTQGRSHQSAIAYSQVDGKRLLYNGQRIQKFSEYIGYIPVVLLAPSDLQISQNGPQQRRQFLDIVLSQSSKLYLHHLIQYRRSLKQRNALLQEDATDANLLRSWEEALVQHGTILIQKRLEAIESLDKMVKEFYGQLSGMADKVKMVYQSSVPFKKPESIAQAYQTAFSNSREKELQTGSTAIGPHRDDVLFLINGKALRAIGSQGEHKTFVIALKMAEFNFLKNVQNETPLLLFDDIFGELDAGRISNMIGSLSRIGQVFITTTSPHFFGKMNNWEADAHFYEIEQGTVSVRESL